jgi:hypothetical protein
LTVEQAAPTVEIEVLNSNFEAVASGIGSLETKLEPGLYEIRFRQGSEQHTQLLKVGRREQRKVRAPQFEAASAAPVAGTSTSQDSHEQSVLRATEAIENECSGPGPATGGIVVMVRNVSPEQLPFPEDLPERLCVVDSDLAEIGACGIWASDPSAGWALWRAALRPGGYALRVEDPNAGPALLQAVWVDDGWQTLIFIPNTPDGPAAELATIHLARVGQWSPEAAAGTTAVALESVLEGLRSRRSVVPHDLVELFDAKFSNPFLGIAAAHALLLDPARSLTLLETVIGNLRRLVPGNPDVVALGHRAAAVGAEVQLETGLRWPPMFYAGYRALIRADAANPGVIADGSLAEAAAALVRLCGIWTTWAEAPTSTQPRSRGAADDETNPAAERLLAYLEGAAQVGKKRDVAEILAERSLRQLALATGLPSSAARKAVRALKEQL